MKRLNHSLLAGIVLAGISFGVTACQQAPAPAVSAAPAPEAVPAPAPAPTTVVEQQPVVVEDRRPVVVEHDRPGVGVNIDVGGRHDDRAHVDIHAH